MSTTQVKQAAIITGGGKNLGALIAEKLAARGIDIVIHYNSDSSKADAQSTLGRLQAAGVKAAAIQADLREAGEVEKLFANAKEAIGVARFDIAINTVGKVLKKPIGEISEAEFDDMFAINSKVAFFFIKHAEKNLADGGCIISLVTSLLGAFAPGYATYQGSKSPVEWFTKSAAKEYVQAVYLFGTDRGRYQPRGIRVNCVAPGPMDTPFFYPQEEPEAVAFHKSQGLGGRLTAIEDIAPLIDFLTVDKWITGQIIFSNGGYTTR